MNVNISIKTNQDNNISTVSSVVCLHLCLLLVSEEGVSGVFVACAQLADGQV